MRFDPPLRVRRVHRNRVKIASGFGVRILDSNPEPVTPIDHQHAQRSNPKHLWLAGGVTAYATSCEELISLQEGDSPRQLQADLLPIANEYAELRGSFGRQHHFVVLAGANRVLPLFEPIQAYQGEPSIVRSE